MQKKQGLEKIYNLKQTVLLVFSCESFALVF